LFPLQAKQVAKQVKKGAHTAAKSKEWHNTTFRRPKTLALTRKAKAVVHSVNKVVTWDKYAVVKQPRSSESAIKTIEDHNTLVFIVDRRATKPLIKKAIQDLYSIKVRKVNTMITPRGLKKAYVILTKDHDALEVANKIGIM
jgi:large subunit ribosomal protein L23Ae